MSLTDWLSDCAQRYPDRIAVMDVASGRRHTFRTFDNRANQIAHFCERWVGLLPGDCVGLLSTPSDDVLQILVAAGKLDLTALLLAPDLVLDVLVSAISRYGPRTLFYGLPQADLGQEIWFEVDSVEQLIPLRGAVDTANFEDIVAHYPPTRPSVEIGEDVPWVRFVAEGITWPDLEAATAISDLPGDGPWRVTAPLHHPIGLAAAVIALRSGRCVVIEADSVTVMESPGEVSSTQEDATAFQRNVPTGRSWLPHEFL
jgi:acyl-CoA synthetase (AMP-forming)/AMP-acid ligase II